MDGVIPFDYFMTRIKALETELGGLAPYSYPYGDDHFNDIGFKLLQARKMEEAYKVFKLSETCCPESWTAYHGLGETYRLMGQKAQAIEYYKKSLKLNPNNEESTRAMARLGGKP